MTKAVKEIVPLGFPWQTSDPFLFCVHHEDFYPAGGDNMGPKEDLTGRNIGNDFTLKDGYRMYHGAEVPGFPAHPHRGFETVTVAKTGLVDHSDSLGAAGRFGNGDVQWMTAAKGVQHCEMFPLLNKEAPNPMELFQIWLNLPKAKKMAEPHFAMLWSEDIPVHVQKDAKGNQTFVDVIAGKLESTVALDPAPDSWAADPKNEVGIWTIKMEPNAEFKVPTASEGVNRRIYLYKGASVDLNQDKLANYQAATLDPTAELTVKNGNEEAYLLLLQGMPIGEPVVQHGPFVMNTAQEIDNTISVYRTTQFGGWPWPTTDHVHPREKGRFALHADGELEERS